MVSNLNIPIIDFHNVLIEHPKPLSLFPVGGGHYTSEGYRLVSKLIEASLEKRVK
jgi:lysophospholipase L1-like esterase|tara:strand:- start:164 stop:328 length:165 start_codon:yes stop_codon:yes gene_type:complete